MEHHAAFTWHGGQTGVAARHYPAAPRPWLDLSTGISPWAWPVPALDLCQWQALPSAEGLHELELAAARAFGMDGADQIAAVPGSDIAIRLLAQILPAGRVAIAGQGYAGYRAAWPGARVLPFAEAREADLLVCANPNNPDGAVIAAGELRQLAGLRIVDEAFADAMPGVSILPERGGAIVLRSFGKFFGLAGVRLGFVIADKSLILELRRLLGDWPISGPAIAIGTAAYRDLPWQGEQRRRLAEGSGRLAEMLEFHGLEPAGCTANFILAHAPGADRLFDHLCKAGILTRPFADRPDHLRFGIPGLQADWNRLATALQTWSSAND